jgi:hypothetical protein
MRSVSSAVVAPGRHLGSRDEQALGVFPHDQQVDVAGLMALSGVSAA